MGKTILEETELLIALTIAGTLTALALTGFHELREASRIRAATRSVWSHLSMARTHALGRRETVRVRLGPTGDLVVLDASGRPIKSAIVGPDGDLPVDSVRVRPHTLRFNPRGQAAPGSVYLHLGTRTVRVVSNFLGRIRVE